MEQIEKYGISTSDFDIYRGVWVIPVPGLHSGACFLSNDRPARRRSEAQEDQNATFEKTCWTLTDRIDPEIFKAATAAFFYVLSHQKTAQKKKAAKFDSLLQRINSFAVSERRD
jgi:hypothetical protein